MILIQIYLLIAPGLIALKIKQYLTKEEYTNQKMIIDFLILSFAILLLSYMTLYLSDHNRMVSFSANGNIPDSALNITHLYRAGFVLKYGITSLICAIISGVCYSFTKINPIILAKEVRKELKTLKNEVSSSKSKGSKLF